MRDRVKEQAKSIKDTRVRKMFSDCFFNSLDTATEMLEDGTAYVFTGDIPAMWLRDSSVQIIGYVPYATEDPEVKTLVKGLLKRQWKFIQLDPYANAFNHTPHPNRHKDETNFESPYVWERKYETDSLCYPLWLALRYYEATKDSEIFDTEFFDAFETIINTFIVEQNHDTKSSYFFKRTGDFAFDTLENNGKGSPTAKCGLTWSAFRPSDDRCVYHYLVPANLMAAHVIKSLVKNLKENNPDKKVVLKKADKLAGEILKGVKKRGTVKHSEFGEIYAYETDGFGNHLLMDDANMPSLLSLPYFSCCAPTDKLYKNTRNFILSEHNPYFFSGKYASGIGSPHTPKNYIWHIALAAQLLTSTDPEEKKKCFEMLITTDGGKGFMHEGFDKDNPANYTREWFGWANTLFGLAVVDMLKSGFSL